MQVLKNSFVKGLQKSRITEMASWNKIARRPNNVDASKKIPRLPENTKISLQKGCKIIQMLQELHYNRNSFLNNIAGLPS